MKKNLNKNIITREKKVRTILNNSGISITWLKQSNIVTLMRGDYGVMHYRVLINVIHKLQDAMEESINGIIFEQLTLFKEFNSTGKIIISIPYKDFGIEPNQYCQLKKVLRDISTIPVELDTVDPISGNPAWAVSGLFKAYISKKNYERNCSIEIDQEVAKALVDMNKGFTKYGKEIALKATSKYTVPIYFLISSWKAKGGFSITLEKFRKKFNLTNKYLEYKDLYKRVIKPASDELFEFGDCWFEVAEFYKEDKKNPYKLNFKIIKGGLTQQEKDFFSLHKNYLIGMLTRHFHMQDKHFQKLFQYIDINNIIQAEEKTIELYQYVLKNSKTISNIPEYCLKAMIDNLVPVTDVIEE